MTFAETAFKTIYCTPPSGNPLTLGDALPGLLTGGVDETAPLGLTPDTFFSAFRPDTVRGLPIVPLIRKHGGGTSLVAASLASKAHAREFFNDTAGQILHSTDAPDEMKTEAPLFHLSFRPPRLIGDCEYETFRESRVDMPVQRTGPFFTLDGVGLFLTLGAGLYICKLTCGFRSTNGISLSQGALLSFRNIDSPPTVDATGYHISIYDRDMAKWMFGLHTGSGFSEELALQVATRIFEAGQFSREELRKFRIRGVKGFEAEPGETETGDQYTDALGAIELYSTGTAADHETPLLTVNIDPDSGDMTISLRPPMVQAGAWPFAPKLRQAIAQGMLTFGH